jgi:hypothetical protein
MPTATTKIVRAVNRDLPAGAAWGERAAWEANRILEESDLDAKLVDWGLDPSAEAVWLNVDSGDFNMDLAVTREFLAFHGFRDRKAQFLSHVRRIHPAVFAQNGVARHLYDLDVQADGGVDVIYEGGQRFRDFTADAKREAEELAAREKAWAEEEKERKNAAKERAAQAKAAAQ